MNEYCYDCGKSTEWERVEEFETVKVRGVPFTVKATYHKCKNCGEKYSLVGPSENADIDPLEEAYRCYRDHVGMLQPEIIKGKREVMKMTVADLARKLGISEIDLNRIENGSLQTQDLDRRLRKVLKC
jgi:ribosome-binding protein aMBF1 (putative translation factor)